MEKRLTWLDATRGIAVGMVVIAHTLDYFWKAYNDYIQLGNAGVVLFFLCSGYVIPMSLEHLSARDFWVRRFFRLFPLYWVSIVLFVLLGMNEVRSWPELAINLTMLQSFVGVSHASAIFWSLTVELTFYILMTVLRTVRIHKQSLLLVTLTLLASLLLILFGQKLGEVFVFLSFCFLGTVFYRRDQLVYSQRQLMLALSLAVVFIIFVPIPLNWRAGWMCAIVVFVLMYSSQAYTFPSWLLWCGTISYSIYLLHPIPLALSNGLGFPLIPLLAAITYFLIERPGIAFGRRFSGSSIVHANRELRRSV